MFSAQIALGRGEHQGSCAFKFRLFEFDCVSHHHGISRAFGRRNDDGEGDLSASAGGLYGLYKLLQLAIEFVNDLPASEVTNGVYKTSAHGVFQ